MGANEISFTVFKGSSSGDIIETKTTRPPLTGDQVLISITASSLCGGDFLFKNGDVSFPLHPISLANN